MPNTPMNEERAKFIEDLRNEKSKYEAELRADPNDPAAKANLKRVNSVLERYGEQLPNEDNSKMKDGGMARGKGNKMYKHNYATGGNVVDHLSRPVGPPQSVQAMTAVVETPAQRSKRLRSGG